MNKSIERIVYGLLLFIFEGLLFGGLGMLFKVILEGAETFSQTNIATTYFGILFPFVVLGIAYYIRRLYAFDTHLIWEEMKKLLDAHTVTFVLMVIIYIYLLKYDKITWLIFTFITFFALDIVLRFFYRTSLYDSKLLRINVAIIGNGFQGEEFAAVIKQHKFSNYNLVGFIRYDSQENKDKKPIDYIGNFSAIEKLIEKYKIVELVIAVPKIDRQELSKIIEKLENKIPRIKFIPDMYGLMTFSNQIHDYDRVLAISAAQGLLKPINRVYKRIFDIVVGTIGLLLFSVAYLFVAGKIKKDGGKALYSHKRVGRNMKMFNIYKFRSMYKDADVRLKELLDKDEEMKEEFYRNFKLKDDPRVTEIGKFIRKTSIDELPQFLNVIKGEMSIVGPRPIVQKEVEMYYGEDVAKRIFSVRSGITGMWQANGRSDVENYAERIELDIYYIRNWSIWLDIVLILKTIANVLGKKGAY